MGFFLVFKIIKPIEKSYLIVTFEFYLISGFFFSILIGIHWFFKYWPIIIITKVFSINCMTINFLESSSVINFILNMFTINKTKRNLKKYCVNQRLSTKLWISVNKIIYLFIFISDNIYSFSHKMFYCKL